MPEPLAGRRNTAIVATIVVALALGAGIFALSQDRDRATARNARASVGPTGTVWIADEDGASLTAIDARTGMVRMTAKGIEGPHNVQVSDDGKQVWAVSGHDSMLVGIDTEHLRQIGIAATGAHPAHVVLAADNSEAYVTSSEDDAVTAIDLSSMKRRGSTRVGRFPHGLRLSPDGNVLLVANMHGTTVSVVDRRSMRLLGDIEVGRTPVQVAWMVDSRYAFVSLNAEDAVVKIDVKERRVIGRASTDPGPAQTYVTADGSKLLIANQGTAENPSRTLSVIDPQTMRSTATIETGAGAHGITGDPSGRYAFVTNMFADEVAFVDLEKMKVVARTRVGKLPNGISFSPRALDAEVARTMHLDMGYTVGMERDEGDDAH